MADSSVNFRVNGSEVESYIESLRNRANSLSKEMINNAKLESDLGKEQLQSYNRQIAALERKLLTQNQLSRQEVDLNRDQEITGIQSRVGKKYEDLDRQAQSGQLTGEQYRKEIEALDQREVYLTQQANERYQEQLQQLQEQTRLDQIGIRMLREVSDSVTTSSAQQLHQMRKGDEDLVDAVKDDANPTDKLANQIASERYTQENDTKERRKERSEFGSILKALAFERVGGMIAQLPSTSNELDYAKPIASAIGLALGGGLGSLVDLVSGVSIAGFKLGQTSLGEIGAQFGEKIGEFVGGAFERTFQSREALTSANFRLQATTGLNMGINTFGRGGLGGAGKSSITPDLSRYGLDFIETANLQQGIATSQGTGSNLSRNVEDLVAIKQAFGVGEDIFLTLTELLRSSEEGNKDVLNLVGGVAAAGSSNLFSQDRTFLSEFLQKNFTSLQQNLLQTSETVASGTTFDILRRFDQVGGQFGARDPRSMGLVNTIQGSLSNPNSDNVRALSFLSLREQNPGLSISRLIEEQQKGLSSPTYLRSMLSHIEQMGGGEDMNILNTAGVFGLTNNVAAARRLWKNRGALMSGDISVEELTAQGEFSREQIQQTGAMQTGKYTSSTAQIENAFIDGATKGLSVAAVKMGDLFGDMISQVKQYVDEQIDKTLRPLAIDQVKKNKESRDTW